MKLGLNPEIYGVDGCEPEEVKVSIPAIEESYTEEERKQMKRLRRLAKDFHERSNVRGLTCVASDWLIISLCASSYLLIDHLGFWFWLLYLLCATIIASRLRGLENLVHEASHYNLFSTRYLNDRLEILFAIPVFRLVKDYRASHTVHHRYLGDVTIDPDIQRYEKLGINALPNNYWWILFIRPLTGYMMIEYLQTTLTSFWISPTSRLAKSAFWLTFVLLVAVSGSWSFILLYWVVPFFVILPITRFWAEAAEHSALDLNIEVASSRNNIGLLHRWLLHPHNDGFHEVHHLYPSIPWYRLADANVSLMDDSYFQQYCIESHSVLTTFSQMAKPINLRNSQTSQSTV